VAPAFVEHLYKCLTDFGDLRLETMDKSGIARSVLSISGPGVQAERDPAVATKKAREANDFLAVEIQKRPDRYTGFATSRYRIRARRRTRSSAACAI
jgi:2,3-dihydroxybenzoate decarboxylase